ncbi:hypothetical protein Tco_0117436 [Tanacetum coccineum]
MELVLEQTQQDTRYEVLISVEGVEELKGKVKIKGEKKEALLTLRQKLELRSLKLGDLGIDAYFLKIESIATMLKSLGSPVTNDDVITFALEGLSEKYENVCGIITHRETFLKLKTARSMLITEEMRLKSMSQA